MGKVWTVSEQRQFRSTVIELVLCTDLGSGLAIINKLEFTKDEIKAEIFASPNGCYGTDEGRDKHSGNKKHILSYERRLLVMQNALRCADISHPTKAPELHKRWTKRINEEFFAQGRREKELGLPISPLCDENDFDLAKSQQ